MGNSLAVYSKSTLLIAALQAIAKLSGLKQQPLVQFTILWGSSLGWDQLGSYADLGQLTGLIHANVVSCCVGWGLVGLGWLQLRKSVFAPFVSYPPVDQARFVYMAAEQSPKSRNL